MKKILVFLSLVIFVVTVSVFAQSAKTNMQTDEIQFEDGTFTGSKTKDDDIKLVAGMVRYGNGVYYFEKVEEGFAEKLSSFLSYNTNLEVTAMAPRMNKMNDYPPGTISRNDGNYSLIVGYFVTFREKK